jgi:cation-transporting P-type ATPase 13A2
VIGDPLEEELLNFAKAEIEGTTELHGMKYIKVIKIGRGNKESLGIVDVFGFKSELQRMGVVVHNPKNGEIFCYLKGAPERIVELSDPASLPKDINQQIADFAKSGYRVIAFASNRLQQNAPGEEYTREQGERGAQFQGLALFKNNLKEATKPVLDRLKQNDFYTGMITGDNINTAISVSKTCGIVDITIEDTAMCTYTHGSGKLTYNLLNVIGDVVGVIDIKNKNPSGKKIIGAIDNLNFAVIIKEFNLELNKPIDLKKAPVLSEICENVRVFARMDPHQKALIVKTYKEYYKKENYTVGFCGDGANDCIALKHADIGVSLSKNESSLSAPFISSVEDISAMENVSIIGKAALTTNFDCFRYFCLYSIIQTIGLIILFSLGTEYSVPMYLTMDVPIALNVANAMGLMAPFKSLTKKMPKHTLIYAKFLISIILNCVYTFGFMVFGIWMMRTDPMFVSAKDFALVGISDEIPTFESTITSLLALQGTIHLGVTFNLAGHFKDRWNCQVYMIISLIIYILYQFYLIFNSRTMWPKVDNFLMDNYNFVVFE